MAQPVFNAKTLPLGQDPLVAAANYDVTTNNAVSKFQKIYADRRTVDGGSKAIYDKLVQWSSPEAIKARGGNPNDTQWSLLRKAVTTGKVDPNLKPELLQRGLGLGLTETARAQQHKPQSFLSKFGGSLLTAGLAFIPVVGPYAAAAAGGYFGSKNGPLGAILGAAGGYLGGKSILNAGGASGIYNSAREGLGSLLSSGGFSNPAALGINGGNLGLGLSSGSFGAAPVAGYGASSLGLTGGNLGLNFASGALPGVAASNLGSINNVTAGVGRGLAEGGVTSDSLYTPRSAGPMPASSALDNAVRGARTGARIAGAVDAMNTPQPGPMAAPMMGGARPSAMAAHGAIMRPLLPYNYPDNPFMTRIV